MLLNEELGKMVVNTLIYNQKNIESLEELGENLQIQDGYPPEICENENLCVKVKQTIDQLIKNGGEIELCEGSAQDIKGNDIKIRTSVKLDKDIDITVQGKVYNLNGEKLFEGRPYFNPQSAEEYFFGLIRDYNKEVKKRENEIKIPKDIAGIIINKPRPFGNDFGYILPCYDTKNPVTIQFAQGEPIHTAHQNKEVDINMFFVRDSEIEKRGDDYYVNIDPNKGYSVAFTKDEVEDIKNEFGIKDSNYNWVTNVIGSLSGEKVKHGLEAMMEMIQDAIEHSEVDIIISGTKDIIDPNKILEKPEEIAG